MAAIDAFCRNIIRARSLAGLGGYLDDATGAVVELSDVYRASLVLAVSAFDHFVHEVVLQEMMATFDGTRTASQAFRQFKVPASFSLAPTRMAFEQIVREDHGWKTFQKSDKVKEALRLAVDGNIWTGVAAEIGKVEHELRNRLDVIVDRRNKIAHEADVDPVWNNVRPLSRPDLDDAISFLSRLAYAIVAVVG